MFISFHQKPSKIERDLVFLAFLAFEMTLKVKFDLSRDDFNFGMTVIFNLIKFSV